MEESPTKVRKRLQHEDSMGNNLQNRIWSHGDESEDEIASENALLNEVDRNQPRFVRKQVRTYRNYLPIGLFLRVIIVRAVLNHIDN